MEGTVNGSVAETPRWTIVLVLVAASLACAPWSWIVDGLTPSWVVWLTAAAGFAARDRR